MSDTALRKNSLVRFKKSRRYGKVEEVSFGLGSPAQYNVRYHNGMKLTNTWVEADKLQTISREEFAALVQKSGNTSWYGKY